MQRASQQKAGEFFTADVYRTLFEQSPDGILVTDQEGNLLASNATAHRALGYTSKEFAHLDFSLLNTVQDPDEAQFHHRKVMEEGRTEFEHNQKTKRGTIRQVLVTTQKLMFSGLTLFHTTWHDISESKRIRTELNESIRNLKEEKAKAEAIMNAMGDNVSIRRPDFRLIYQNRALTDVFGDHVGELCYQAFHGRDQVCEGCPVALAFKDGKNHTAEQKPTTVAGEQYFESTASLVRDTSGNVIAAIEVSRNITEKKRAEQELREAHTRLESLLNAIPDMVLFKDTQGRWLVMNQAMEKAIGQAREDVLGKLDEEIVPPDLAVMCRASDARAMRATGPVHIEESMSSIEGETISLDTIKAAMYDEQGNLSGVVMVSRDITERKKAEEALARSLQEKTVLLKEIHHRVKNNLQIIYSLLNIQAKGIDDAAMRAKFEESRDRVLSMALIHEKLYNSEDLARVDFKEYLQNLISHIADTYKREDITISIDMEPVVLDVNVGIPCGLIVHELVSNSFKYAFPESGKGTIRVGISMHSAGEYVLFVEDSGIGLPAEIDYRNTSSLGLQLVNGLTGQIHGKIELLNECGAKFSMTFQGNLERRGAQNG